MSECSEQQQNNAPSNMSAASLVQAADEMATSNNTETVTSEPLSSKLIAEHSSPNSDNKKAAAKRTPSKRLSFIERAQKESEELVRNMGGSLELEGGRRTRSSTRGTPTRAVAVGTPPLSKKARNSPSSLAATPTRARGKGRKLNTTTDTDDETNTTAPAKKEKLLKIKRGATERKEEQQDVLKKEEEGEGKSENKADNNVQKNQLVITPPVEEDDKKVNDLEAMPATQSTEDVPDAVLDPVPEETESQTNDDLLDKSQLEVNSQEQSTVAVEQKLPPSSAVLTNETGTEQKLEEEEATTTTTTAAAAVAVNKTKTVDLTEEEEDQEEEEETATKTIPKIMDCMTNDVEPMEVDSSSKSNDAVEVIESDNNSTVVDKAKTIDKSLENVVVLSAVGEVKTKELSDNTVPDTNTNTSTTNAIIIDNKAAGDSEMINVLEMNNCTSLNEHKINNTDKDISETEMVETSAPAITAANNTNVTTPSI